MRDIQFISLVDNIIVLDVQDGGSTVTLTVSPTSLYISGVEIADPLIGVETVPFSDITILSDILIKIKKPSRLSNSDFSTVTYTFVTSEITNTSKSKLLFNPTERVISVSGLQKLLQQIVKVLLTSSGSNRHNPEEGGNLMYMLGEVTGSNDPKLYIAPIEDAIERTRDFIVDQQLGKVLPASERLLSLEVVDYELSIDGQLDVKIKVGTLAGDSVSIPISI